MKNRSIVTFLSVCILSSCVSKVQQVSKDDLVSIQIKDQNGLSETISVKERILTYQNVNFTDPQPYKQVLRVYGKDQEGKSHCILTSYHPNGNIYQYLEGIDTIAHGSYKEWYANGKPKIIASVIGGPCDLHPAAQKEWLFHGKSEAWDEEGNRAANIFYEMGVLEGPSYFFFPNQNLFQVVPHKNNKIHGEVCEYYENGLLKSKCFYDHGKQNGPGLGYWENETPAFFEEYDDGKLKTGIYYDISGKVISEIQGGSGLKAIFSDNSLERLIEYRDGMQNGKVQIFTRRGEIVNQYIIQDGSKQGEEVEFYLSNELREHSRKLPQAKLVVHWDHDVIHGTVKTWYPNGKLESQKEFCRNKKNGMSFGWYTDGTLMFVEEYEKDRLLKGSYYKPHQKNPVSKVVDGSGAASLYDGKTGTYLRKIRYVNGIPQE